MPTACSRALKRSRCPSSAIFLARWTATWTVRSRRTRFANMPGSAARSASLTGEDRAPRRSSPQQLKRKMTPAVSRRGPPIYRKGVYLHGQIFDLEMVAAHLHHVLDDFRSFPACWSDRRGNRHRAQWAGVVTGLGLWLRAFELGCHRLDHVEKLIRRGVDAFESDPTGVGHTLQGPSGSNGGIGLIQTVERASQLLQLFCVQHRASFRELFKSASCHRQCMHGTDFGRLGRQSDNPMSLPARAFRLDLDVPATRAPGETAHELRELTPPTQDFVIVSGRLLLQGHGGNDCQGAVLAVL